MSRPLKTLLLAGPLVLFIILASLFAFKLISYDPDSIPNVSNALAGKPVPKTIIPLFDETGDINPETFFKGRIKLVNFWGSWCKDCRVEHPVLVQLSNDKRFDLVGINYRDTKQNATRFLNSFNNPYTIIGFDPANRIAIDWGVYGAPETFLVDQDGIIRYKHIGAMNEKVFAEKFEPIIEDLLKKQQATPSDNQ